MVFNPDADFIFQPDDTAIVMGWLDDIERFRVHGDTRPFGMSGSDCWLGGMDRVGDAQTGMPKLPLRRLPQGFDLSSPRVLAGAPGRTVAVSLRAP